MSAFTETSTVPAERSTSSVTSMSSGSISPVVFPSTLKRA